MGKQSYLKKIIQQEQLPSLTNINDTSQNLSPTFQFSNRMIHGGFTQKLKIQEVLTLTDNQLQEVLCKVEERARERNQNQINENKKLLVDTSNYASKKKIPKIFSTLESESRNNSDFRKGELLLMPRIKQPKVKINFNATSSMLEEDQHKLRFMNVKIHKAQDNINAQNQQLSSQNSDSYIHHNNNPFKGKHHSIVPAQFNPSHHQQSQSHMNSFISDAINGSILLLPKIYPETQSLSVMHKNPQPKLFKSLKSRKTQSQTSVENLNPSMTSCFKIADQSKLQSIIFDKQRHESIKNEQKFVKDFSVQKNSMVKIIHQYSTKLKKLDQREKSKSNVEMMKEAKKARRDLLKQIQSNKATSVKTLKEIAKGYSNSKQSNKDLDSLKYEIDYPEQKKLKLKKLLNKDNNSGRKAVLFTQDQSLQAFDSSSKQTTPLMGLKRESHHIPKVDIINYQTKTGSTVSLSNSVQDDDFRSLQKSITQMQHLSQKMNAIQTGSLIHSPSLMVSNEMSMIKDPKYFSSHIKSPILEQDYQYQCLPMKNQMIATFVNQKINNNKKFSVKLKKRQSMTQSNMSFSKRQQVGSMIVSHKQPNKDLSDLEDDEQDLLLSFDVKIKKTSSNLKLL